MSRSPVPRCAALALVVSLAGTGCREKDVTYYETPHEEQHTTAATAPQGMGGGMPGADGAVAASPRPAGGPQLEWDKPAGWTEQPASQMRLASYLHTAPDGTKADISVFVFPDAAGGLLANINRWRGQVGLAPVAEADLATTAQPARIVGQSAWKVDLVGTPDGAAGPTRIIGAIIPVSGQAWFFKMMGPDAVVSSQREAFDQMLASMRAVTPSTTSGNPSAADASAPAGPVAPDATMPQDATHSGLAPGMGSMAGNVPPPPSAAGFTFTAPPDWQEQPSTPFRVVNFFVPDAAGGNPGQFYATPLSGRAGGELANVNRWLGQLGQPPVDEAGLGALASTVTGPAGTFRVFDLNGTDAQTGQPARMLAGILVRGETSWFFRLTGSPATVAAHRGDFENFLRSVGFADAP